MLPFRIFAKEVSTKQKQEKTSRRSRSLVRREAGIAGGTFVVWYIRRWRQAAVICTATVRADVTVRPIESMKKGSERKIMLLHKNQPKYVKLQAKTVHLSLHDR